MVPHRGAVELGFSRVFRVTSPTGLFCHFLCLLYISTQSLQCLSVHIYIYLYTLLVLYIYICTLHDMASTSYDIEYDLGHSSNSTINNGVKNDPTVKSEEVLPPPHPDSSNSKEFLGYGHSKRLDLFITALDGGEVVELVATVDPRAILYVDTGDPIDLRSLARLGFNSAPKRSIPVYTSAALNACNQADTAPYTPAPPTQLWPPSAPAPATFASCPPFPTDVPSSLHHLLVWDARKLTWTKSTWFCTLERTLPWDHNCTKNLQSFAKDYKDYYGVPTGPSFDELTQLLIQAGTLHQAFDPLLLDVIAYPIFDGFFSATFTRQFYSWLLLFLDHVGRSLVYQLPEQYNGLQLWRLLRERGCGNASRLAEFYTILHNVSSLTWPVSGTPEEYFATVSRSLSAFERSLQLTMPSWFIVALLLKGLPSTLSPVRDSILAITDKSAITPLHVMSLIGQFLHNNSTPLVPAVLAIPGNQPEKGGNGKGKTSTRRCFLCNSTEHTNPRDCDPRSKREASCTTCVRLGQDPSSHIAATHDAYTNWQTKLNKKRTAPIHNDTSE